MSEDAPDPARIALPLLVASLILIPTIGMGSILSSDDALYAQMAREMVESGAWLEPTWMGAPIFDKPPLLFWMLASLGWLFGFTEATLRAPGVLGGLVALYYVVRLVDQTAESADVREQLVRRAVAVALALGTVTFVMTVRRPMADPLLMAAVLAHLHYGLRAVDREPGAATKAGIALGLGLLAKWIAVGPVALVVALGWLARRRLGALLVSSSVAGIVAAPWHLWMSARHGEGFWNTYLGYHVLDRASAPLVGEDDPLYYIRVLAEQDPLLAAVFGLGLVMACLRLTVRDRPFASGALALSWVVAAALVTLFVLHMSSTRLFHYLLPVVPLAAVATTAAVDRMPSPEIAYRILGTAAVLGFLMGPLHPHLLAPDYGARSATLAERHLASLPEDARLILWEDYDPATLWYAQRPGMIYTANEHFYGVQVSIDMMRRSGVVVWADDEARDALMTSNNPIVFVAPQARGALLERWSEHASLRRRVRFVRDPELDRLVAIWGPAR